MITDIVFPKNNEKEFIQLAEELEVKTLCFLYSIDEFDKKQKEYDTKVKILSGIYTEEKKIQKARKKSNIVVVTKVDDVRGCVERFKPDILFGMEQDTKKDYMHQRNAGINHAICNLGKKKEVSFGFLLSDILYSRKKEVLLGRMRQNIGLFRKYGNRMIIATGAKNPYQMRNMRDLAELFNIIGMRPEESKKAIRDASVLFDYNERKKKGEVIDGVEVVN